MKRILFAGAAALVLTSAASAQVLQEKNMPLNLAVNIANETIAACSAKGYNVAVAVTPAAATAKAFTSASSRTPTGVMAENIQKNPAAAELANIPGFLVLAGGVPVKVGDATIGAIGVGGAPGGHLDEACAVEALDKVKDQLK
ncbi:heme-binding protein [Pseudochrobactrum sp. XF203]|uniref:GlcG/HbpS family heme-binding protein n=1 Tax=Pseudochrobactrum sp. XF203 TaxID=2879116 RepID=UPI001CE266BE|nr:heme-binding protein [Pseudochrobactrum sp. XF203]UCA46944.1 heme-binding protein [Pseudochrobactrum sp. XF203]